MATSERVLEVLFHDVYQPDIICRSPIDTRFVQIEITIFLYISMRHHDCLADRFTTSDPYYQEETRHVDLRLLSNHERATQTLSAMLRRFPISPTSHLFDVIIDKLIRRGLEIGNSASATRGTVFPLRADICGEVTDHHEISQDDLMRRALAESESLRNNGMVPANQSSVKKMLKRVRVEDGGRGKDVVKRRRVKGEDCVICCEEIKVGSFASRMPCSHTFHRNCIEKWLKESHYCPLCRFEMPTEKQSS